MQTGMTRLDRHSSMHDTCICKLGLRSFTCNILPALLCCTRHLGRRLCPRWHTRAARAPTAR